MNSKIEEINISLKFMRTSIEYIRKFILNQNVLQQEISNGIAI